MKNLLLILALFFVSCDEVKDTVIKEKEIGFECSNFSDKYQLIYKRYGEGLFVNEEKSGDLRIYSLHTHLMFKLEGEYYMSLNQENSTRFTINRVSLKYA